MGVLVDVRVDVLVRVLVRSEYRCRSRLRYGCKFGMVLVDSVSTGTCQCRSSCNCRCIGDCSCQGNGWVGVMVAVDGAPQVTEQIHLGNDLLCLAGAGPSQLCDRTTAIFIILQHNGILSGSGLELWFRNNSVGPMIVHLSITSDIVDPQPDAIIDLV